MIVQDKITLDFAEISLVKDKIVIVEYLTEDPINVDRGIRMLETVRKISNNEPCAIIHNVGDKYIFTTDALRFMGSQLTTDGHHFLARAIVTTNPAARIASNNFIKFYKPLLPTKLFTETAAAVTWLEGILSSEK